MDTRKATRSGPHAQNGLAIWRARKRSGLTQEKLAEVVGVSRIQMIKLENGMHLPKQATRDRLTEILGVDPSVIKCEQEAARPGEPFRAAGVGSSRATAGARAGSGSRGGEGDGAAAACNDVTEDAA